jgi:hypothetical protein
MSSTVPAPVDDATELTRGAWRVLRDEMRDLRRSLRGPVIPIAEFLAMADAAPSPLEERLDLVAQAELLFEHLYPHMPFKTDLFGSLHPGDFLDAARREARKGGETAFHRLMLAAFSIVRDPHTSYGLPSPYLGAVAFLPFTMKVVVDPEGRRRFVVTRIMSSRAGRRGFGHPFFGPGAEIVQWGGLAANEHVGGCAGLIPCGNADAEIARATLASTIRPLQFVYPPGPGESPAVDLHYRPFVGSAETRVIRIPWGVARFGSREGLPARSFSLSPVNAEFNSCLRRLQLRDQLRSERRLARTKDRRIVSTIPGVFSFQYRGRRDKRFPIPATALRHPGAPRARFGYLRIRKFNDGGSPIAMTERLVDEARRILALLDEAAPHGLVLDIRGNAGGDIEAAEQMLQMLTPREIEPLTFQFANTKAVQRVIRRLRRASRGAAGEALLQFGQWLSDPFLPPLPGGDRLTAGHPLTNRKEANAIGQVYHGPVVLMTDSFTYSAAEMFAAGFQDHGIGKILGENQRTGGGGANAWDHPDLLKNLGPEPGLRVKRLPRDATMRLAMRRCARRNGEPIEDIGVRCDVDYDVMTVDDVLAGLPGMIAKAVELLASMPVSRVDVSNVRARADGSVSLKARCLNLTGLRLFLDDEPAAEIEVKHGRTKRVVVPAAAGVDEPSVLRIEGFGGAPPAPATVRKVVLRKQREEESEDFDE